MSTSLPLPPTIPTISLRDPRLGDAILDACTSSGFFYLCDHGIAQHETDRLFALSRDFSALEEATKRRFMDRASNTGFTPIKHESLDPSKASDGDLKESFYLARLATTASGSTPESVEHRPPTQLLPAGLGSSKDDVARFIEQCKAVTDEVLRGFANALHLDDPAFFKGNHHGAHDRLRLIHYPPSSPSSDQGASIRAGAHSDYGSVTLLFQKDVGGLQVELEGSGWIDIPPKQGCIVVNVGDAMEFWTAGLFRSTQHRVVMPRNDSEASSRYSMAYFCQPDENCVLQPLPLSSQVLEAIGNRRTAMDPAEFESRLRRKGVDVDSARAAYRGDAPFGHLGQIKLTGGQHLRARLAATYKA
ncbi:uncharacterized protein PFL1_03782 [Pseudozyma flocculosa PF-1]|uniref:Related to oxidoreductase n=2 Tax=Pseudozyma flocculosa TaxID=84751 RepID=A0A5C3EXQ2_9BASI|nr:uncharacterized protein PFL1_03782 [Pseudozyma flocculosa PF-1]EPQ28479.1 hypothetical protein PFL1_03782 [Pseudozyma flocculosa PF-1]SPO36396.1 related to oxidoreductase [Pseudozyma flocculosa]